MQCKIIALGALFGAMFGGVFGMPHRARAMAKASKLCDSDVPIFGSREENLAAQQLSSTHRSFERRSCFIRLRFRVA